MTDTLIRIATANDVAPLVALGRVLHAESPNWSRFAYSEDRAGKTLRTLIESDAGVLLVAEHEGAVVGGIAAIVLPHWAADIAVGCELSLFIDPAQRGGLTAARLVRAMVDAVQAKGAALLQCGSSSGVKTDRVVALYERLGFKRYGAAVERVFSNGC